jgi:PAS domain S-box-containing protein
VSSSTRAASSRRRAEEALVRSEHRYCELVEHSLGLICVHDLDGQLLFVNPAAARTLGWASDYWEGRNLREFVPPEAHPLFDAYLQRIAAKREDTGLMRLLDRQGQEHFWMYHNVRSDAAGEAPQVVGHALDITDRVHAEQVARRHQEDLERAYRTLDDRVRSRTAELETANQQLREEMAERRRAEEMRAAVMTRERNTLTFLATASDQLTQAPDYEAALKTLARLPVPFLADWTTLHTCRDEDTWCCLGARSADGAHKPLFAQLLSLDPQPLDDQCRLTHVARTRELAVTSDTMAHTAGSMAEALFGSGIHLQYLASLPCRSAVVVPVVVDDRVLAILTLASGTPDRYQPAELAVIHDLVRRCQVALTQVRLYREAQEANRLKDEFLATLSHELRTPLNAMLGWARILRSRSLDEKTDHAVQVIERNAEAQARLIEDVLDVSRIITGKLALDVETVHLPAVVLAALDSIRPAATAKGIRLVEQVEPTSTVSGESRRRDEELPKRALALGVFADPPDPHEVAAIAAWAPRCAWAVYRARGFVPLPRVEHPDVRRRRPTPGVTRPTAFDVQPGDRVATCQDPIIVSEIEVGEGRRIADRAVARVVKQQRVGAPATVMSGHTGDQLTNGTRVGAVACGGDDDHLAPVECGRQVARGAELMHVGVVASLAQLGHDAAQRRGAFGARPGRGRLSKEHDAHANLRSQVASRANAMDEYRGRRWAAPGQSKDDSTHAGPGWRTIGAGSLPRQGR